MKRYISILLALITLCTLSAGCGVKVTTDAEATATLPQITQEVTAAPSLTPSTEATLAPTETPVLTETPMPSPTVKVTAKVTAKPTVKPTIKPIPTAVPVNFYGNTGGNLSEKGYAARQGDFIYYRNQDDGDYLYKISISSGKKTKICNDKPIFINVVGDWVYYIDHYYLSISDSTVYHFCAYKIKTDGTGRTNLKRGLGYLYVAGDRMYYKKIEDPNSFYCAKTDGTQESKIFDGQMDFIDIADGWIYFRNYNDNWYKYKMRVDGTGLKKMSNINGLYMQVSDGWIYYCDTNAEYSLWKIRVDGSNKTLITQQHIYKFVVGGDHIAMVVDMGIYGALYSIQTDGKNLITMNQDIAVENINIAGDWIYYYEGLHNSNYILHKVKIDGTEEQKIS